MEIKSTQDIEQALKSGKHLAVKFGASWCNPCKAFKPVFDKVTSKHADAVQACEFDIDDDDEGLCEHSALEVCRQQSCSEQTARLSVL